MSSPAGPGELVDAAQRAAGVIAAMHRGDHDGAEALLAAFPDQATRTRGFYLLSEVALELLRAEAGVSMDEMAAEISLHLAAALGSESR